MCSRIAEQRTRKGRLFCSGRPHSQLKLSRWRLRALFKLRPAAALRLRTQDFLVCSSISTRVTDRESMAMEHMPIPKCTFEALTCAQIFMNLKGPCITWELISLPGALFLERNKRAARPANNSALDRRSADSDEAGHAFQSEAGHLFRSEAGRGSDLMSATLRRAAAGRWDDVFL